ncbi:MAG: flagellar hook-associated protein FlgL [Burkholderiales bacterium]|nr:flagellar hook-associated protein FlgL [Burkholderiales bacterium]MDE2075474.1 flagellar hook-associated protein FlgL [Burkholderiales bacterium]MDE2432612.1 flagellar hook-associated protein FlgL [Burkholderiales bacterium]
MRVSTSHAYDLAIEALQQRQSDLSTSQMQLTTGKRVNVPSDDPIAAARAERDLATEGRADADQRALDASRNVMQIAESSMGNAVDLLQQARETLVAAGNGSYTDSERQAVSKKLQEIRTQLLSVANRPDGGGGFIFGGQGSATPPFVDAPGGVQFVGQGGETQSPSGEKMSMTVDGQNVWLKAASGNGVFVTDAASANTGSAWISPGSVSDPRTNPYLTGTSSAPYAIGFQVAGGVTTYTINGGAPTPYTSGQAISVAGMSFTITGAPANGDQFTINPSQKNLSVFDSLDSAIKALNTPRMNNGQITQAVNKGISQMDSLLSTMQGGRSAVGEMLNRMDGTASRIAGSKLAAQTDRSNAEDLDLTSAISDFQSKQAGYDAAMKSYSIVQKMSLFQYLNP